MLITVFLILLTLILSLLTWNCFKLISRKLKYPNLPPSYPGAVPIFGHLFVFLKNRRTMWEYLKGISENILAKNEPVCTLTVFNYNVHVITDPDDCNSFANTCLSRFELRDLAKPFFGDGLLTSDVPKWKRHRKMLIPAMNQQVIDGFYEIFNDKYRELAHSLINKVNTGEFDISEYVKRTTLGSIFSTVMGYRDKEMSCDVKNEYIKLFPLIFGCFIERMYNIWLCVDFMYRWSPLKNKVDNVVSKLNTLTDTIIGQKINYKTEDKNENQFKPYLEHLLGLLTKNLISKQDVKDEATNIIFAGYDTTQSTIIETLLVLGTYSDVQNKVYKEIQEVFGDKERDVEKGDLAKLKYLDALIKETLRLYPVVPFVVRKIEKDVTFKKYIIPAGDGIVLPFYALHRHPVWGEDANAFNPDRWLDRSTLPETNNAFASFSIGRRNCIGINYAMTSVKIAIVHMIRRFEISADIKQVEFDFKITLAPISGHLVSLESRISPDSNIVPVSAPIYPTKQCNKGHEQDEKE